MHVFLLKRGQFLLNLQSLIKERLSMQKRILIVSQEVSPYISDGGIADGVLNLAKIVKKNPGVEVRLMMPKYGCVNERRHQLHEVIRLSGVNIVVNDIDQPLIVKVASIPQARLQVYFIDNDEYFQRKLLLNEKDNTLVKDNDERMMFFSRGVLETLQMLGWSPNIIHCHGWFTSLIPLYLKTIYANHPVFEPTNIISSFYKKSLKGTLDKKIIDKIEFDGVDRSIIEEMKKPNAENLHKIATRFSDGIIIEDKNLNTAINEYATKAETPILEANAEEAQDYYKFYQKFFSEALV